MTWRVPKLVAVGLVNTTRVSLCVMPMENRLILIDSFDSKLVQDKMYAECGRKGTWKYNNRIDSCKMNYPSKPKPPSNSGGSCNQNKTPHVDGKF